MSQQIYISSADRNSGNSNDFLIFIDDQLLRDQHKDLMISEAIIPHSYYAINDNNNTFECGPTGADTITLTNGNYTSSEFATHLTTQLNVVLVPTYSTAFSTNTGKFTFSTGDSSEFVLVADTKNYKYLGFAISTSNSSASGSLVSTNVINISGTEYIDILSNLQLASENSSNLNRDVLARVYPNSAAFSSIFYNATSDSSVHFEGQHINRLHLRLVDEFGDPLSLNGLNWNFTLKTVPREVANHANQAKQTQHADITRGF
jgi:hypothetical protein